MIKISIRGLYAITDDRLTHPELIDKVEQVISGGASLIQYRNKSSDQTRRTQDAADLLELCRGYQVPLIINDDIQLAKDIRANGVHLGKEDESIQQARAVLGKQAIIGVSCYNDLALAMKAESMGADYVAFGSFSASPTKPGAVTAPIEILRQAKTRLSIPVVAIGGITPHNAALLIETGADAVAVINGLFAQANPADAAHQYARLFHGMEQTRIFA